MATTSYHPKYSAEDSQYLVCLCSRAFHPESGPWRGRARFPRLSRIGASTYPVFYMLRLEVNLPTGRRGPLSLRLDSAHCPEGALFLLWPAWC